MPEDTAALSAKVDMLIEEVRQLRAEQRAMKTDFDQSKGAVRLIKWSTAFAAAVATIWASIHLGVK